MVELLDRRLSKFWSKNIETDEMGKKKRKSEISSWRPPEQYDFILFDPWGAQSSVLVSLASDLEKNDP